MAKAGAFLYSRREHQAISELFKLVVSCPKALRELVADATADDTDALADSLVALGLSTGLIVEVVRVFVEQEFRRDTADSGEGSIMRGNTIASKIVKLFLNKRGGVYLKEVVGSLVHQLVGPEHKALYEIDPSKCESPDEAARNLQPLLQKVRSIVDNLCSPRRIEAMPVEIREIATCFQDLAKQYSPNQVWPLVGGFLLLRYVCPALMAPEVYGLCPPGKPPGQNARRNLTLITKILQNASSGVEFGKKEQWLIPANPFIADSIPRLEQYFQAVVALSKKRAPVPVDAAAAGAEDLHTMHAAFARKADVLLSRFSDAADAEHFSGLLGKLASLESKSAFSALAPVEQKAVAALLEPNCDELSYVGPVEVKGKSGMKNRILVVSLSRLMLIKLETGKLAKQGHLLALVEISSRMSPEVQVQFAGCPPLSLQTDDVDRVVTCLRANLQRSFPGMPEKLRFRTLVNPPSRLVDLPAASDPYGGFAVGYESLCQFYGTPISPAVAALFEPPAVAVAPPSARRPLGASASAADARLPPSAFGADSGNDAFATTFDMQRLAALHLELTGHPLASAEFGPVFWALRFNLHFDRIVIRDFKVDKEAFLDFSEMLKFNRTVSTVVASNCGASREGYVSMFEAMTANAAACAVTACDVSSSHVEDKGLSTLAAFLEACPHEFLELNLADTGVGKHGLLPLFSAIQHRGPPYGGLGLCRLDLSDNRLASSHDAFVALLSTAVPTLKELRIANTAPVLPALLDGLRTGCPQLQLLDLSRNRLKPPDVETLSSYLESCTSLRELCLASTRLPTESLKRLLTAPKPPLSLKMNLRDNQFGLQGAWIVASVPLHIDALTGLDLSDNDFGDEGITAIANGLCSNSTLQSLILDRNFKGTGKQRLAAVDSLWKLASARSNLLSLGMAGSPRTTHCLKTDIIPFLHALQSNTSLTELDVSGHLMGDAGFSVLAHALHLNQALTSLSWHDNAVGYVGLVDLKNALKVNRSLRHAPVPPSDVKQAAKERSQQEVEECLFQIEKRLLRNRRTSGV